MGLLSLLPDLSLLRGSRQRKRGVEGLGYAIAALLLVDIYA